MRSGITALLICFATIFSISCSKPTENSSDKKEVPKSVSTAKLGGTGYKDYRWGMTSSDAIAINSKIKKTKEDRWTAFNGIHLYAADKGSKEFNYSETGGIAHPLGVEKGKITYFKLQDEDMEFLFVNDGLRSIIMSFKYDPLPSLYEKYGKIDMKQWGLPRGYGLINYNSCYWVDGDRIINFNDFIPSIGYPSVEYIDKNWIDGLYSIVASEAQKRANNVKGKID